MKTVRIEVQIQLDCISDNIITEVSNVIAEVNEILESRGEVVNYMQIFSQFDILEVEGNTHEED